MRRFVWLVAALTAAALAAAPAGLRADSVGYEPPEDVVLLWGRRACVVMTLVSVALIGYVLAFRRARLGEAQSQWLLFLGICVLPVPVTFLSGGIGMEESKAVTFCASCHASMGPFVRDMQARGSQTLAAVHYQNRYVQREQCWNCHSDYGIAGTASAKRTGLVHMVKYTTGAWQPPIRLFAPYNWRICLGCHGESLRFQSPRNDPGAHESVVEEVLAGRVGCTDCHPMAHPDPQERSTR